METGIVNTERLILFWGEWPSQWSPARFVFDGTEYNCCEQYMMAEKARVFGDDATLQKILGSTSPRQQKAMGRKVRGFEGALWNEVCRGIVYTGNLARFSQNPDHRDLLLATGMKTIVEASPVDRIWGVGLAPGDPRAADPSQWCGTNWLGIALMQVRDTLRQVELTDTDLLQQLQRRREIGGRELSRTRQP
jgi:ribA/ribD-fused uncharacterized protein